MTIRILLAAFAAVVSMNIAALAADAPKLFHGIGKVTAVDAQNGLVMLNHQTIPGLMDAMEMQFEAKPANLLEGVKVGDAVEFDLDGAYVIHAIRKN